MSIEKNVINETVEIIFLRLRELNIDDTHIKKQLFLIKKYIRRI